jgi:hypothetical protein
MIPSDGLQKKRWVSDLNGASLLAITNALNGVKLARIEGHSGFILHTAGFRYVFNVQWLLNIESDFCQKLLCSDPFLNLSLFHTFFRVIDQKRYYSHYQVDLFKVVKAMKFTWNCTSWLHRASLCLQNLSIVSQIPWTDGFQSMNPWTGIPGSLPSKNGRGRTRNPIGIRPSLGSDSN